VAIEAIALLWMNMQSGYDLWHAKEKMGSVVCRIEPFNYAQYEDRAGKKIIDK
jgi:plasmid maintenance system antidote protein VapI